MRIRPIATMSLVIAGCAGNGTGGGDDGGGMRPGFTNGVSTLAGDSVAGYVDGDREVNLFHNPVNVAFRDGLVYVADFDNSKLRSVASDGNTATVIDMPAFSRPFGMA